jgi:hypothetical protein
VITVEYVQQIIKNKNNLNQDQLEDLRNFLNVLAKITFKNKIKEI